MAKLPDDPTIIELTEMLAADLSAIHQGLKLAAAALDVEDAQDDEAAAVSALLLSTGLATAATASRQAMTTIAIAGAIARIRKLDPTNEKAVAGAHKSLPLLKEHLKPEYYAAVLAHLEAVPTGAPLDA